MATIQDDITRHRDVPNRAFITLTADISLILLSTIFIATRLYGRKFISKTLGLDDGAAFISLGLLLAATAFEFSEVSHGMGKHLVDVSSSDFAIFVQHVTASMLVFLNSLFFTRLAGLLFIRRLLTLWKSDTILWLIVALYTTLHLIFTCLFLTLCHSVPGFWRHSIKGSCVRMSPIREIIFAQSGVGIFADAALFVVPVVFTWRTLSSDTMRVRVTILLGVGLFTCVAAVTRVYMFRQQLVTQDPTWDYVQTSLWTQLECHIGLIGSCFPAVNLVCRKWFGDNDSDGSVENSVRRVSPGTDSVDIWIEIGECIRPPDVHV